VAKPYNRKLFKAIDRAPQSALATFTGAWRQALVAGKKVERFNDGTKYNHVLNIGQTIHPYIRPQQGSAQTRKIRSQFKGDFVLGHFGKGGFNRLSTVFIKAWKQFVKRHPGAWMYCVGFNPYISNELNKRLFPIPNLVYKASVKHAEMPYHISACDLTFEFRPLERWQVPGSLKTKESAACGVPILMPFSQARQEEVGKDYNLFIDLEVFQDLNSQTNIDQIVQLLLFAKQEKQKMAEISQDLRRSMKAKFSVKASTERWRRNIRALLK
jgi:glycosyltransferase involved in cell wall biosynthesis